MSDVQAALDYFKRTNDNASALADPQAILFAAQVAWMQAVTDHLVALTISTAQPPAETESNTSSASEKTEAAGVAASAQADAAPSSTEPATIAPTTPSA